jgi:hypothetical protein
MAVCAREGEWAGYGKRVEKGVNGGAVTTGSGSVWRCAVVQSSVGGNASAECWWKVKGGRELRRGGYRDMWILKGCTRAIEVSTSGLQCLEAVWRSLKILSCR